MSEIIKILLVEDNSSLGLCVLDVMMPKKDGFSLAEDIRSLNEDVPIVFLTAKGMEEDRIAGFKAGADDYITKPFSQEELLLRLKAILKRKGNNSDKKNEHFFSIGSFTFDQNSFVLKSPQSERRLTKKEADLLKLLAKHTNKVLERSLVANMVWGEDSYFVGRSMDVFITRLRKYLKEDQSVKIVNIHGVGFSLEVE